MTKVLTKTSNQFGKVRTVSENSKILYCGSDVARALGYGNPQRAIRAHCRGMTKMVTPTNSGSQNMIFIPEADVYRLICHSKMPKAMEFEKWIFEDVVPKAVEKQTTRSVTEQLTLETSEYHYYDKTFGGNPVLTPSDVEHFTGIGKSTVEYYLKKHCRHRVDYTLLDKVWLSQYKAENPSVSKTSSTVFVVHKSGFVKLMKYYGKTGTPKCFEEKEKALPIKTEIPEPQNVGTDECIVALNVLRWLKHYSEKRETEHAERKETSMAERYGKDVEALVKAIQLAGMLVACGD